MEYKNSRYETARKNWDEIIGNLQNNKQKLAEYFKFSSRLYKHSFSDAVMIYKQNPKATKVLELKEWNRLGRYVNRGAVSIAAFGKGHKCRHFFDVSQTNGKKEPALWSMDKQVENQLIKAANEKYNADYKSLKEVIAKASIEAINNNIMEFADKIYSMKMNAEQLNEYKKSVVSAARYIVGNRCELGSNEIEAVTGINLRAVDLCRNKADFINYCDLVQRSAKEALLNLERDIIKLIKQNRINAAPIYKMPFSLNDSVEIENDIYKISNIDVKSGRVLMTSLSDDKKLNKSVEEMTVYCLNEEKHEQNILNAIDTVLENNNQIIVNNTPVSVSDVPPLTEEKLNADKSQQLNLFDVQKKEPEIKENQSVKPENYRFSSENIVTGAKSKYKANIEAIKTLMKIENENRYATAEEQNILAGYSGWGGISQAFDSDNHKWKNEYEELKNLLPENEYADAKASSLTSFYTPPEIADGIYQALEQFGFKGGNILEPSMGIGNFFSKIPEQMSRNSKLYGVEIDSISGKIAEKLYPDADIQIKGFEKTNFSNNSFDAVIGNIPFGDFKVFDRNYNKYNFKIHDYFAAKSVDKIKLGGIAAFVTSKFTMDKQNEKTRMYLAERCNLLGAVRLPDNAFKATAGTEVTTDILFFQKRDTHTIDVPDWVHISETADGIPCNKYFADNPDMILGKMEFDRKMQEKYGSDSKATTCTAVYDDLSEQLKNAVSKIQGKIRTAAADRVNDRIPETIPADPSVRNFTHTLVNGQLYHRQNEVMVKVDVPAKKLDRMLGLHKIRQSAMAVINAQSEGCTDDELKNLQKELNYVYDRFVKNYGHITDKSNAQAFQNDDDYNTLAAFEITDKKTGEVKKAEIFTKRTITPEIEITRVDTPEEALQVSLNRLGRVDIEYMSELSQTEPQQLINELGNRIYRNPVYADNEKLWSGYEEASEYLSGNIRQKIEIAELYAEKDKNYERNIAALRENLPQKIEANDISVRIGANWIEEKDYSKFFEEYAKADMRYHNLRRTPDGEYKIENKSGDRSVNAISNFGTSRMSSYTIFENLLNNRD